MAQIGRRLWRPAGREILLHGAHIYHVLRGRVDFATATRPWMMT
jgi:hypothetical protein